MISYTRKRRDSTSSTMTVQPEHQSRRRSLRNVPNISAMIKSTSLRSMDTLDGVSLAPSTSRPLTRRQSLTRATASSLAKMVNFTSSSSDNHNNSPVGHMPSPTTSTKQPSRLNKLLKKKKTQPLVPPTPMPTTSYHTYGSVTKKLQQSENTTSTAAQYHHLPSPPPTPLCKRRWSPFRSPRTSHESYSFDDEEDTVEDKPPQLPPIENGSFSLELSISEHRRRSMPPCLTPSSSEKKRYSTGCAYYPSSSSSSTTTTTTANPRPSLPVLHRSTSPRSKLKSCSACPRGQKGGAGPNNDDQDNHTHAIDKQDEEEEEEKAVKEKEDREAFMCTHHQQQQQPGAGCGEEPHEVLLVDDVASDEEEEEDIMTVVLMPDDEKNGITNASTDDIGVEPTAESDMTATYIGNDNYDSLMQTNADMVQPAAVDIPMADDPLPPSPVTPLTPTDDEVVEALAVVDYPVPSGDLPVADEVTPVQTEEQQPPMPSSEYHDDDEQHHEQASEIDVVQEPYNVDGDAQDDLAIEQVLASARPSCPPGIVLMQSICSRATLVPAADQSLVRIVASCIAHADKLEALAADLSRSEDRVNELLDAHQALIQSLDAREHRYMMHVQAYERLLASQAQMIAQLEAIQGKLSSRPLQRWQPPTTTSSSWWPSHRPAIEGTIISQHKNDLGYTTDIVVAGTCIAPDPPQHLVLAPQDAKPTLYHHYLLHIKQEERSVKYVLCPAEKWVPDDQAAACQQPSCQTSFGLFTRRHHCRSCGHVVCNTHSLNRLPLFKPLDRNRGEWARVCDACFYRLLEPN